MSIKTPPPFYPPQMVMYGVSVDGWRPLEPQPFLPPTTTLTTSNLGFATIAELEALTKRIEAIEAALAKKKRHKRRARK